MLLDATFEIQEEDKVLLDLIKNKNYIVLINKIDVDVKINKNEIETILNRNNENNNSGKLNEKMLRIIEISAKEEIGIEKLEEQIEEMFHFNQMDINNEIVITNARHKEAISKAKEKILKVLNANKMCIPIDMLSIDLQNAVQYLGEITGESVSEDVINGIFKKFCLGK